PACYYYRVSHRVVSVLPASSRIEGPEKGGSLEKAQLTESPPCLIIYPHLFIFWKITGQTKNRHRKKNE
ncbi:MAG: hypothetical protein L0Y73_04565, partial [Candidatus Aminicenantes bacterium]|nr:hypothetical protein [Candidatus Aminicenantes bacterium]